MPSPFSLRWAGFLLALAALTLSLSLGCAPSRAEGLLAGLTPHRAVEVDRVRALNDGVVAHRGDVWDADLAAILRSRGSHVDFDLGRTVTVRAAYLVADDNDEYHLSISEDGSAFTPLWTARAQGGRGLQPRWASDLSGSGRFVRIAPGRGDGSFSVSEVALYEEVPAQLPPRLETRRGLPAGEVVRSALLVFALAAAAALVILHRGAKPGWIAFAVLLPLLAGVRLWEALELAWPVGPREVALFRAVSAALAAVAVAREAFSAKDHPPHRGAVLGALGLAAALSLGSFFNLGHPQFWDHKAAAPDFVHKRDMRVYFPVAKYFDELRYDGLYLASVAAYLDDVPNASVESLRAVELRDLRDHQMRRVGEVAGEIEAVKRRFSPERWASFLIDMRYFREAMGDDYLHSLNDHGANATPVWMSIAYLLFAKMEATHRGLFLAGLLDPLLLLAMFVAVARTFGVRTMLVAAVVFGANDFYMFGSNWAGATLRHDWMAYLGLGACALRTRRFALGGGLLALAAMIRAFPAFALVGAAVPALYWVWDVRRHAGRLPSLDELRRAQRPVLDVAAGAATCTALFVLLSFLLFTPSVWVEWLKKIALLDSDPHVNDVSLRVLVAGSDHLHHAVLGARMPLFVVAIALIVLGVVMACGGKTPARASLLGLLLIPVAFNPANYYLHFVFLLPLLAEETREGPRRARDALLWLALLLVCVAQYPTVLVKDWDLHFFQASALLFAGIAAVLVIVVRADWPILAAAMASGRALPLVGDDDPHVAPGEGAAGEARRADEEGEEDPPADDDGDPPPDEGDPESDDDKDDEDDEDEPDDKEEANASLEPRRRRT